MDAADVAAMQETRLRGEVDDSLLDYALEIVERTRTTEQLSLGVSPRGAVMLHRAAQARAFLEGRDYCLPDDFKRLIVPGFRAPRGGQLALRLHAKEIRAGRSDPPRNSRNHARSTLMRAGVTAGGRMTLSWIEPDRHMLRQNGGSSSSPLVEQRDRAGWRNFGIAMLALAVAFFVALFSAATAQEGRVWLAAITTLISLAIAGWVAVAIVPALARRTSLRWMAYQIDYRLTRDGIIYLAAVFILVLAAVNTGNNLLFLILACLLAGILISGMLSRVVLTGIELKFDLPEHIFAEQPVLAEIELRNDKQAWPSFSLRVIGGAKKSPAEILARPVFFPYIPRTSAARQKVELRFPRRGVYRQDSFGIRTRFPFGFFEKTRQVDSNHRDRRVPARRADRPVLRSPAAADRRNGQLLPRAADTSCTPCATTCRPTARASWTGKCRAKSGSPDGSRIRARGRAPRDARARSLSRTAARRSRPARRRRTCRTLRARRFPGRLHRLALPRDSTPCMQFRTNRFSTPMAPAGEIIYDTLRELALIQADTSAAGGAFLDELASESEIFKIILTARPQRTIPTGLWSSSYFLFVDRL